MHSLDFIHTYFTEEKIEVRIFSFVCYDNTLYFYFHLCVSVAENDSANIGTASRRVVAARQHGDQIVRSACGCQVGAYF